MNKLWVFGDSFTDRYIISNNKAYTNWKGRTPRCYHEILGQELNLPVANFAESYGMDNYTIFQTLCNNINNIENDVVVINWSEPVRHRMVDTVLDKWRTVLPIISSRVKKGLPYVNGVEDNIVLGIFENRKHPLWLTEIESWCDVINKALITSKVCHWTWYKNEQFQTITEETNGEVIDFHYSEKGHTDLAEWILQELKKGKNKILYNKNSIL